VCPLVPICSKTLVFVHYLPEEIESVPEKIVDSICFAVRVLRIWNSLPEDVVSAALSSLFISRLVRVNLNQFRIGKM